MARARGPGRLPGRGWLLLGAVSCSARTQCVFCDRRRGDPFRVGPPVIPKHAATSGGSGTQAQLGCLGSRFRPRYISRRLVLQSEGRVRPTWTTGLRLGLVPHSLIAVALLDPWHRGLVLLSTRFGAISKVRRSHRKEMQIDGPRMGKKVVGVWKGHGKTVNKCRVEGDFNVPKGCRAIAFGLPEVQWQPTAVEEPLVTAVMESMVPKVAPRGAGHIAENV